MILKEVLDNFSTEKLKDNKIELYNINDTVKILIIYKKFIEYNNTIVLITSDTKEADKLYNSFCNIENVYLFYEIDVLKKYTTKSNDLEQISLEILNNLVKNKKMILIIPLTAIFRTIKSPKDFSRYNVNISMDNFIPFSELSKLLLDMGYKLVNSVENIGEFSIRGSIIDVYSPLNELPVRLDYFDEEIDSIRTFDTISQKSLKVIDNVCLYPNGEYFLSPEEKNIVIDKIKILLNNDELKKEENYLEIQNYINNKISLYKDTGNFDELYSFSNLIYDELFTIVDYLPIDAEIFFDNYSKIKLKLNDLQQYFSKQLENISNNYIYQPIIDFSSFSKLENNFNNYYLSHFKTLDNYITKSYNINSKDIEIFSGEKEFANELKIKLNLGYKIILLINNVKQKDYIEKVIFDYNLYDFISSSVEVGKIFIYKNENYIKGFELVNEKFLFVNINDLFGIKKTKKKKIKFKYSNSEKIRNYQDLEKGDYIVHINHGIGLYEGIENVKFNGICKDFLKISYEGSDVMYVDIENMKYIQKYTSLNDNRKPKLNKLGTKKWSQVKHKVKKEIEDISEELIRLYISRELKKGYAFSLDSNLQYQFEEDFIYEATDDQKKAVREIKEDMEKERPMDRLLCGDVGFGKTEVAMRASFKAVTDNKQVAILVPTTLLAEQHYNNFLNRFINFPVNIEVVSRFKSNKEINKIIEKLQNGNIDILIGTHKLLNDKFKYKDLGLLIIDEEQRFGVKHKEKIKHLKNTVDVLTLSATPIPRTLHMSLVGIRDLSVLETPPINRQPIQTFVMSENLSVIREAVLNEVEREGQVFYIYNRVETIEEKYLELKKLLPEINIAYAHGQMSQKELEDIIIDVINKEYDMLITTTIIETGIDIANVNTLIIEDADRFGLSQLYQIRGRIGRSSREAYAYLMYKPFKILTENAEKRLQSIKNFTALGSGFKIAMQDLTIRGAGDVLGKKQHGFIDSVGYTLYSQMLEKEITNKKEILEPLLEKDKTQDITYYEQKIKEKMSIVNNIFDIEENNVEIKLNINAFIPKTYIANDGDKIYFYKLLNNANTEEQIFEIIDELIDRYSDYGKEVENLINICLIRISSEEIYVKSIVELKNKIVVNFDKKILENLNGKMFFEVLNPYKNVRIVANETLTIEIDKNKDYSLIKLNEILKLIKQSVVKI